MSSEQSQAKPTTIVRHAFAVYAPMAMLAGMQLDVFTPLKNGPMTAAELATTLGVRTEKLQVLLCALVYAELLTYRDDCFSNTPEADAYLVRGRAKFLGSIHELYPICGATCSRLLNPSATMDLRENTILQRCRMPNSALFSGGCTRVHLRRGNSLQNCSASNVSISC